MSIFASINRFLKEHFFSHFTSKVAIWVVTVLSIAALMYQYFAREDAVSIVTLVGAVVVPFQEGANEIGGFMFDSEQKHIREEEAILKIEELEKQNAELEEKLRELNDMAVENEELRGLLFAKERYGSYEMQEAEVIASDGINCFNRFTINKGSADGIKVDMNVINRDGLVGIVTHVGLNYAIVTSVIEDGMNVSAMTRNGSENFVVSGDMSLGKKGVLRLSNALKEVDLKNDSTVVTSNISDRFLPGLVIGYAFDIEENADDLTKQGFVTTAADFTNIRYVMVITTMREELKETEE